MNDLKRLFQQCDTYMRDMDDFLALLPRKEWKDVASKPQEGFFRHDKEFAKYLEQKRIDYPEIEETNSNATFTDDTMIM